MKNRVFVMLASGFEETDVSTVTRNLRRLGFPVALVGLAAGPVRGAFGLSLLPDWALSEVEMKHPQAVVLPGGVQGARHLNADPRLHTMVRQVIDDRGYVVAIDTAYIILQRAGLLAACEPPSSPGSGVENGGSASRGWHGQTPPLGSVAAPSTTVRLLRGGQVIFDRDSGSALETALTLASLLERGPCVQTGIHPLPGG